MNFTLRQANIYIRKIINTNGQMSLTVPVPAVCPDCESQHITVSTQPPSEHEYSGWTTKISCAECGFEAYQPELD